MTPEHFTGLIVAAHTPFDAGGELNLSVVPQIVEHHIASGISAIYAVGSTGEGVSLRASERMATAEAYVNAAAGRLPIIVQVGSNSLAESCDLAAHAADCGAYAVSANAPSYFKIDTVDGLIDAMAQIASSAPDLPFYHYYIPRFTGSEVDMPEFLDRGGREIPNLAGLKYTDLKVFEYQECLNLDSGRFDILWGCDEMLLSALVVGSKCGVGSTYNIAAPLYRRIIDCYDAGDIEAARKWQLLSVKMVRVLIAHNLHPGIKAVMGMKGIDVGGCRPPLGVLDDSAKASLRKDLDAIGFFEWSENG
ncbi:MAG: dihydrodipicolinate synthase family protein [Phycisphaerae bacterium]|jgi:N-acetylneuraminate lyase|nr:dihydrodipicolinate synthase family protein [Phycisphaerae bacterium]